MTMAVATQTTSTGHGFTVASETRVVSGFPPIYGHVVVDIKTGTGCLFSSSRDDCLAYIEQRQRVTLTWLTAPTNTRCHMPTCRRWAGRDGTEDDRLGWVGFCQDCVLEASKRCVDRFGRLPERGVEFYCPYCGEIRRHPEDRCKVEADGRQRIKCRPCRQDQLQARWERQKQRRPVEIRVDG